MGVPPDMLHTIVDMCKMFHTEVTAASARFLKQMGRHNYVTPTSYLELIGSFASLVAAKRAEVRGTGARGDAVHRAWAWVACCMYLGLQVAACCVLAASCTGSGAAVGAWVPRVAHLLPVCMPHTVCVHTQPIRAQVVAAQQRYEKGLDKLQFTANQVRRMSVCHLHQLPSSTTVSPASLVVQLLVQAPEVCAGSSLPSGLWCGLRAPIRTLSFCPCVERPLPIAPCSLTPPQVTVMKLELQALKPSLESKGREVR